MLCCSLLVVCVYSVVLCYEPPQQHTQQLCGLDNVVAATFPRMATKTFQAEHIQCEMFLFHGMERVKDSFTLTAKAEVSPSPRWMQWMGGTHAQEMLISSLPRVCVHGNERMVDGM